MTLLLAPLIVALFSLVAVVLAYALWPSFRAPSRGPEDARRLELEEERDTLYDAARALDVERASGALDDADYARLRLRDETRAALVLQHLSELPPTSVAPARARSVWPAALAAVVLCAAASAAAYRYAVPALQGLALPPEDRVTLAAARQVPGLEAKLNAEALRDGRASSATLHEFGDIAWKALDYNRAAQAYMTLLGRDPRDAKALARYGAILFFAGRPGDATTFLKTALAVDPRQSDAALTLGNLYFSAGKATEAIKAWQAFQATNPSGPTNRVADLIASARVQVNAANPAAKLYATNCAGCHGSDAQGMVGPKLAGTANAKNAGLVLDRILLGKGQMPAFAGKLTEAQAKALAGYLSRL